MRNRILSLLALGTAATAAVPARSLWAQGAKQVINAPSARPGVLSTAVRVGDVVSGFRVSQLAGDDEALQPQREFRERYATTTR